MVQQHWAERCSLTTVCARMMMEVAGATALEVGSLLVTPTQLTADKLRIIEVDTIFC